jgi:hypothetical protein
VESRHDVNLGNLRPFAEQMARRYEIRGIVPYREDTVEVAAELCALLNLGWNSATTLARFRDKFSLKTFVSERDPGVRVPLSRLVQQREDVWSGPLPDRFVIKPNDGFGNHDVGTFGPDEHAAIESHLARNPGTTWVLEEFIGGEEFHINGQVRSNGEITLLGLWQYQRVEANGYSTVYAAELQCHTHHPLFRPIADYAFRLIRATGLRRCPFHMEVKVDADGPCMIDLGARLPSEGGGDLLSRMHPARADVYAVAAHDSLGENDFATGAIDWTYYDSGTTVMVYGISHAEGVVQDIAGLQEVEAMPEFVTWVIKPRVGDYFAITRDLRGAPYIVELRTTGDRQAAQRLLDEVRATIVWNQATGIGPWLRARAKNLRRRAIPKVRWIAHKVADRLH